MEQWYQLVEIFRDIALTDEPDALVWQYESKGPYSSSSLYHVINFMGCEAFLHSRCLELTCST